MFEFAKELIRENIKEEMKKGKTAQQAMKILILKSVLTFLGVVTFFLAIRLYCWAIIKISNIF